MLSDEQVASRGDEIPVLQLVLDFDSAWNGRDAQALAALFEPDAEKRVHLDVLATTILVKREERWYFSVVRLMLPVT